MLSRCFFKSYGKLHKAYLLLRMTFDFNKPNEFPIFIDRYDDHIEKYFELTNPDPNIQQTK